MILTAGSGKHATSGQLLLNLDAVLRLGGGVESGEGTCGAKTRLGFREADLASGGYSQQSFPFGPCF